MTERDKVLDKCDMLVDVCDRTMKKLIGTQLTKEELRRELKRLSPKKRRGR